MAQERKDLRTEIRHTEQGSFVFSDSFNTYGDATPTPTPTPQFEKKPLPFGN